MRKLIFVRIAATFLLFMPCSTGSWAVSDSLKSKNPNARSVKPINERFASLQAYLRWAESKKQIGMPWYEEVGRRQYQFRPSRGQARDNTIYSYDQLRRKLGFKK